MKEELHNNVIIGLIAIKSYAILLLLTYLIISEYNYMNSSIILQLGNEGKFDRRKLHGFQSYQKESLNLVLDKIELVHSSLLPKKNRKISWYVYLLLLFLFLGSGLYKHQKKMDENGPNSPFRPPPVGDAHNNEPDKKTPLSSGVTSHGENTFKDKDSQKMDEFRGERPHSERNKDEKLYKKKKCKRGKKIMGFFFFIMKSYLLIFPFYFWLELKKTTMTAQRMIIGVIEIENRSLITSFHCKLEAKDLKVIILIQLLEQGLIEPEQTDESGLDVSMKGEESPILLASSHFQKQQSNSKSETSVIFD